MNGLDNKIYIRNDQLLFMVCCMLSFSNMLSLPMELTKVAFQDAWLTFFLCIPYGFLIAFLLYVLMKRKPGKNLFEISQAVCGKWIGGLLNALLILYLLVQLVMHLRLYSDFITSSILSNTPEEFILLLTVCVLIYYGNGSVLELARSATLYFPVWLLMDVFLPIILLNEIDYHKLQPALMEGPVSLWRGGVLGVGAFGDLIALGAFLNQVKNPRGVYVSIKTGIAVSVLILTVWVMLIISTLGAAVASKFIYVGWILTQLIHITDFLDRVDLFELSLWLPNLIIKYCILYLAILTGLASFTKTKNYKPYNLIMGGIVTMMTVVSFSDVRQVIVSILYGSIPATIIVQIMFFGALFLAGAVRKTKPIPLQERRRPNLAMGIAILAGIILLVIGAVQRESISKYGSCFAASYLLCLLAAIYLSLREFKKLPDPS